MSFTINLQNYRLQALTAGNLETVQRRQVARGVW